MSCEDVHSGFKSILAIIGCEQKNAVAESEAGNISQEEVLSSTNALFLVEMERFDATETSLNSPINLLILDCAVLCVVGSICDIKETLYLIHTRNQRDR